MPSRGTPPRTAESIAAFNPAAIPAVAPKWPTPGIDDAVGGRDLVGRRRYAHVGARCREGLPNRGQIAGAVVDEREHGAPRSCTLVHSSPFVDGSARPSCRSFAQATRSARPNALKTAST